MRAADAGRWAADSNGSMERGVAARVLKSLFKVSLVFVCPLLPQGAFAAQSSSNDPQIVAGGDSGELNSAYLDNLLNELRRSGGERIFVVARLGRGETARRLNLARIEGARLYLIESGRTQRERVIFAEGERVEGEGRVEFYLGSRLRLVSLAERGKNIRFTCCEDYIPPRRNKGRSRRRISR